MRKLGWGDDGHVFQLFESTALKVFSHRENYERELQCYLRLRERSLTEIDFGKCYLDHPPDYPPDVIADEQRKLMDLWGNQWGRIQAILWKLEGVGIYYIDPNANNIQLA